MLPLYVLNEVHKMNGAHPNSQCDALVHKAVARGSICVGCHVCQRVLGLARPQGPYKYTTAETHIGGMLCH